jgi:hypothetical protein
LETVQRFIWWKPDGRVNLYEDDLGCLPWKEDWNQDNEPHDNYCGPTAAKNLLHWYESWVVEHSYDRLGSEMHTNDWMSITEALKNCACFCSSVPLCLLPNPVCWAGCTALSDTFFDVGTHPDDMEDTLRKFLPLGNSVGYVLHRGRGNDGLEAIEQVLANGNPIVVLIWTGSTLHWTLITGTFYDQNGTLMIRFANHTDQTWDWFVHQWSFAGLNWPVPDIFSHFGVKPYVWMYYEKTTILRPEYGAGFWIGDGMTSADGRFRLVLQDDSNLCLRKIENDEALWCSMTNGTGAQVVWMQTNGNLVLRNSANAVVWQSRSAGSTGTYYLAVQNDGNVVIYNAWNNKPIWATDTCCH